MNAFVFFRRFWPLLAIVLTVLPATGQQPVTGPGLLGLQPASASAPAVVTVQGGEVVASTSDREVEITVAEAGERLRILDTKTGQTLNLRTKDFSILQGNGENSVQVSGETLTLRRGSAIIAEVRRRSRAGGAPTTAGDSGRELICGAVSPDGLHAVTGHHDGTVRLWDTVAGKELKILRKVQDRVLALCYAAEGREIAVVDGSIIRNMDAITGQERLGTGGSDTRGLQAIAVSANGRRMITARPGNVWISTMALLQRAKKFDHSMEVAHELSISADGRRALCTGGYFNNSDTPLGELAKAWDVETGRVLMEFKPNIRTVIHGVMSPDGTLIALPDLKDRNPLALWNADTGERVRPLATRRSHRKMAFSPDSHLLAAASLEGWLEVFDVATGAVVASFQEAPNSIRYLGWSADQKFVVGGDGQRVKRWAMPTNVSSDAPVAKPSSPELRRLLHDSIVYVVSFLPGKNQFMTSGHDRIVRLYDAETGKELKKFDATSRSAHIHHIALSGDGSKGLMASGLSLGTHGLVFFDVAAWREIRAFDRVEHYVTCVALSADGQKALSGSNEGEIFLWDTQTGKELRRFRISGRGVRTVCFSPDEKHVLYAGGQNDTRIHIWDIASGEEIRALSGHQGQVFEACYVEDGKKIVSASKDQTIRVWDAATGQQLNQVRTEFGITAFGVNGLAIAKDGVRAVIGTDGGGVEVWNLKTLQRMVRYEGHLGHVTSVAISPDMQYVVSGSYDRTARMWPLPPLDASSSQAATSQPSQSSNKDSPK